MPKNDELAPLRRVQDLLRLGLTSNEIVEDLRRLYGLDFVHAVASLAAATLLIGAGLGFPEEPFIRPFTAALGATV